MTGRATDHQILAQRLRGIARSLHELLPMSDSPQAAVLIEYAAERLTLAALALDGGKKGNIHDGLQKDKTPLV